MMRQSAGFTLIEMLVVIAVIGILAALLLPALAAAREKGRRTSCLSHLGQVGAALGSYARTYGGYLPSWKAWWGPDHDWCERDANGVCVFPTDYHSGITAPGDARRTNRYPVARQMDYYVARTPSKTKQTIRLAYWNLQHISRAVGLGYKANSPATSATTVSGFAAGNLNHAPIGLGMLLGSHLEDARVFYCPSAAEMPGDPVHADTGSRGSFSLRHWKEAGGYDKDALMFGDWNSSRYMETVNVVSSSYHYRNMPVGNLYAWHRDFERKRHPRLAVTGMKPRLYAEHGVPLIRTQKQLGASAIVMDTFSKGYDHDAFGNNIGAYYGLTKYSDADETRRFPGYGILAHKNAYNTLYGDGHAAAFNDGSGAITWHSQGRGQNSAGIDGGRVVLAHNLFSSYSDLHMPLGMKTDHGGYKHHPMAVWHEMDVAAGIDVGVDKP